MKASMTVYRTIENDVDATLPEWVRAYAHDIIRYPEVLLRGLVPDPVYTASRIKAHLEPVPIMYQPVLLEAVA